MYTLWCRLNTTPNQEASEVPISGLVITFDHSFENQIDTISALREHSSIEVGARNGHQCAIVIESSSKLDDKKVLQWVHDLPGVADVQIAFVGFDDETVDQPPLPFGSADGILKE